MFTPFAYRQEKLVVVPPTTTTTSTSTTTTTTLPPYDSDAQAFLTATGITDVTISEAINNLVIDLKDNSIWSSLLAIYPMVGGTSTTCKYNLKNPADTDAAFRLSFNGTWTFNSSGAKPDGASGTYANTFLNPTTSLSATNGHISYYSFTNSTGATQVEIGTTSSPAPTGEINLAANYASNFYAFWSNLGGGVANTDSRGFYINNRASNTEGWKNGTRVINTGNGSGTSNYPFFLGAENNAGATNYRNSDRGCSFASIGSTLSSPATFTTIVNDFQTALSRNEF
jgi:hypothetical protein